MKPVYSVAIMTIILSSFYFVFVCFVLFLSLPMQVSVSRTESARFKRISDWRPAKKTALQSKLNPLDHLPLSKPNIYCNSYGVSVTLMAHP